ncbi:MAG: DUF29 domain-containing protein [Rhodopila sp.]
MSDYGTDVLAWSEHQAALLRRLAAGERVNDQVDWENVIEEIEALGISDRRELRNRVATVLLHLIKLQASPSTEPRSAWRETVREQRRAISALLKDSPSLRPALQGAINEVLAAAREDAAAALADHNEQPRADIGEMCFTVDEVLGPWLPN